MERTLAYGYGLLMNAAEILFNKFLKNGKNRKKIKSQTFLRTAYVAQNGKNHKSFATIKKDCF